MMLLVQQCATAFVCISSSFVLQQCTVQSAHSLTWKLTRCLHLSFSTALAAVAVSDASVCYEQVNVCACAVQLCMHSDS
jgi:hypothetical protein